MNPPHPRATRLPSTLFPATSQKRISPFSCLAPLRGHLFLLLGILMTSCAHVPFLHSESSVKGKVVCVDPGHGGTAATDNYRVGPAGEREEWIDLRVALLLKEELESRGARVILTRAADIDVPLKDRAKLARENKSDVFVSIHHNATADRSVNFPIVYFNANSSENQASVFLAKCIAKEIARALYDAPPPISVVSDHTIFPTAGAAVLRESYGIPGALGEASFFSNAEEEQRLKDPEYNRKEAMAYARALEAFFSAPPLPIRERYSTGRIPPLQSLQEAERMQDVAKKWREDYESAKRLLAEDPQRNLQAAADLFLQSERSFPDSPVARDCHTQRAEILRKLAQPDEAAAEQRRVKEYYVVTNDGL